MNSKTVTVRLNKLSTYVNLHYFFYRTAAAWRLAIVDVIKMCLQRFSVAYLLVHTDITASSSNNGRFVQGYCVLSVFLNYCRQEVSVMFTE